MGGIFIEGKPIEKYLEDQERDRKSHEVEGIRKSQETKYHKAVVYTSERVQKDNRRVARRVRRLPADQIRKEYGLMNKPYGTNIENVLWCIVNKAPITTKEIAKELKYTGDLSSTMANVWNSLGCTGKGGSACLIDRSRVKGKGPRRFAYFVLDKKLTVEQIYKDFKKHQNVKAEYFRGKKKAKKVDKAKSAIINDFMQDIEKMVSVQIASRVAQYMADNIEQIINVVQSQIDTASDVAKLEVGGKVDVNFNFNFGRGD